MRKEIRKLGIDILSEASWGTHLCQFYQTKEDLIDILVPYLKAGLENNEFCMWVTSEPLRVEDAKKSLKKVVKKLDDYIKKGQIEILDASQWYTKSGKFEPDKVLEGWVEKEKEALKRGFSGLRLTGNTFWLDKRDWRNFADYEAVVNNVIGKYRMIAICSYSLDKCGVSEVIDVMNRHQFALIRRKGKWVLVESTERKKIDSKLRESENKCRTLLENLPQKIFFKDRNSVYISCNENYARDLNIKPDEITGKTDYNFFPRELAEKYRADDKKIMDSGKIEHIEEDYIQDGQKVFVHTVKTPVRDENGDIVGILGIFWDITEQKRAEQGLAKERNLLRTVIDNLPDYVYIKDTDSRYIVSNKAHARFLGKETPEGVIGKTVFELFPRELAENYAADDQKIIKKVQPLLIREEHSVDPRGNKVWNLTTKVPLRDSDGKVVGLVGIARDITERKKTEEALRESEEQYRTLVQNVPIAVYRTTPGAKGKFLMGNPTCLKIFGLDSEEELKKIAVADMHINPKNRKAFSDNLLDKESVSGVELPLRKKDGTVFWGSVTARLVYDENGKDPYFDCTIIDITERKKAEEALRESEERYRTLLQNVPVAVYRTMPGAKGKFLMANPTFLKMFGFDLEEELEKISVADVNINPEDRKVFSDTLLAKGSVSGVELQLRKKDGTPFWGSVTARVVYDKNGKNPCFDCTVMDITARKRAEDELKKRMHELETFQKVAVGRELRMVELKKRIKELEASLIEK